jgi:enterochelin esterase-like enzyme
VPLTSLRLLVALGLAATMMLALAVRGAVQRHRLQAVGAAVLSLVILLASVAAGVNRHFDLYRQWADLFGPTSPDLFRVAGTQDLQRATSTVLATGQQPSRGTLLSVVIPDQGRGLQVAGSYVYLPPQYRSLAWAHRTFPVVEAFHGSPGRPSDWIDGVAADAQLDRAIQGGILPPLIMVFPPSNKSFLRSLECTNTRDGLRDEDYLTTDVHQWVDAHLRASKERWTALGFSTGGYCALDLAVRHPDLYGRVISFDGYGQALNDHYARGLWRSRSDREAHSPDSWVLHHPAHAQSFYLGAGTHDRGAAKDALASWSALGRSGWRTADSDLVVEPGGRHTFPAWRAAFLPGLKWAFTPTVPDSVAVLRAQATLTSTSGQSRPQHGFKRE